MDIQNYDFLQEEFKKQRQEFLSFLEALQFFFNNDYDGQVAYMKEHWGEVTDKKIIYYGKHCTVDIALGADKKYQFEFKCESCDIRDLKDHLPELITSLKDAGAEKDIAEQYPEIAEQMFSEEATEEKEQKFDTLDSSYIQAYNNINYQKKQTEE